MTDEATQAPEQAPAQDAGRMERIDLGQDFRVRGRGIDTRQDQRGRTRQSRASKRAA